MCGLSSSNYIAQWVYPLILGASIVSASIVLSRLAYFIQARFSRLLLKNKQVPETCLLIPVYSYIIQWESNRMVN